MAMLYFGPSFYITLKRAELNEDNLDTIPNISTTTQSEQLCESTREILPQGSGFVLTILLHTICFAKISKKEKVNMDSQIPG